MPWTIARRGLRSLGIARGQGWEATVAKLTATPDGMSLEERLAVRQLLTEHALCGEKSIRLYRISEATKLAALETLTSLTIQPTPFTGAFPALLTPEEVEANFPAAATPVAVQHLPNGLAVVFASIRGFQFREELDRDSLPEEVQDALAGYDEVIGIRQEKRQTFEVVFVPFDGDLVEVRVDCPDGTPRSASFAVQSQVKSSFNNLLGSQVLQDPVNLFGLIDAMYSAESEGTVVELAFSTTTASTKFEKMRRRHLCLRQEVYHRAGKEALTAPIEPFRVSIEWDVPLPNDVMSRPELSIHSTQSMRDAELPNLCDVGIRHAVGQADYDFVMSRLQHFLQELETAVESS
ncbi:hypothetical protein [Rhodovarius sp.]|uniref:hypothetical protein n=1 Tax=Rhodovarius sp. TaxID=2972673 RepID=UPI0033410CCB